MEGLGNHVWQTSGEFVSNRRYQPSGYQKIEKDYMMTLSPSQARDYHELKSGTYQTNTVQERAVAHQIVKNQEDPVKQQGRVKKRPYKRLTANLKHQTCYR
ncbi:hypothetical protein EJ377_17340 [Chryseobacterium arthrosphaerae]|uniref:Uncharacterized protein n=1 Tax=Chryseobacterium arthrosphaerae TaxID=651561 RepID=A0A432DST2_9FLAO|nr:hypothetical protein EJ377_17340 [Chryseobacterium arthrosphaerae]